MALHIHAQVNIPYATGLPEDVAVNNWSFELADDTGTELAQAANFLIVFYEGVANKLSPVLDMENTVFKFYRRSDPIPRTPIGTQVVDLGNANTGGVFPEEVAMCLSFRGVLESGQPAARRRGRVYLGPLSDNVIVGGTPSGLRAAISNSTMTQVLDAYELAWAELTTAGNVHEVWSPSDSDGYPIVQAWMDNEFDTQRSRGVRASVRQTIDGPW